MMRVKYAGNIATTTRGKQSMAISFPNHSRSYGTASTAVGSRTRMTERGPKPSETGGEVTGSRSPLGTS